MARDDSWLLDLLARALALGNEEVSKADSRRAIPQFLRFAALFSLSVIVPALLLSFFALRSISAEELQVDADFTRRGEALAVAVYQDIQETFRRFESQTSDRLVRGQSPLTNLSDLSPYLRAAFRFDAEGQLVAPFHFGEFTIPREPVPAYRRLWTEGARAERAEDWALALDRYRAAVAVAFDPSLAGQAELAAARVLAHAGHTTDADRALAAVYAEYANVRDRFGFRIGDLAGLKRSELAIARGDDAGRVELEALVEQILSDRWTTGRPGEAAVARRALAVLEGSSDPDWIGRARIRLAERTSQLYWAGALLDELELFAGEYARVDAGQFKYTMRAESGSLWSTLWVGDSLYAFSFDYGAIITDLRTDLRRSARLDDELFAQVLPLEASTPEGTLRRQTLAPWGPFHTVVIGLRDPGSIVAKKLRMRRSRLLVIFLAVAMSVLGILASLRLVGNELDAARTKADFAANVSHELRSPITQIRLKAESLQLDLVYDDKDRQAHYDAIVREAERLSRLVDNVLDFAAIERGVKRYTFRPEDVTAMLEQSVDAAKGDFEGRDLEFEVDIPDDLPVVWCDREAMGQVMTNLLSNAAKYGSDGGWVGVRARLVGDRVSVAVSDRGLGISATDREQIFDHFFRSTDPEVRRRKGTGIGLSIVRYIVEAHGGTITVQSVPGEITTFTFTLPLENPDGDSA